MREASCYAAFEPRLADSLQTVIVRSYVFDARAASEHLHTVSLSSASNPEHAYNPPPHLFCSSGRPSPNHHLIRLARVAPPPTCAHPSASVRAGLTLAYSIKAQKHQITLNVRR